MKVKVETGLAFVKKQVVVLVLIACLAVSASLNIYQYTHSSSERIHLSSFHFSWVNYQNATQTMDVVFEAVPTLVGANLSVTAKIFTGSVKSTDSHGVEYMQMKYLGAPLILGFDGDGQLKEGDFVFYFYNDWRSDAWFVDETHYSIASGFSDMEGWWKWGFDNKSYCTYTMNFRLTSTSYYPSWGHPQHPYNEITLKNDLLFIHLYPFWTYIHFDPEGKLT